MADSIEKETASFNSVYVLIDEPGDLALFSGAQEIDTDKLGEHLQKFSGAIQYSERAPTVGIISNLRRHGKGASLGKIVSTRPGPSSQTDTRKRQREARGQKVGAAKIT